MKKRNPIMVFVLSLITLGIYSIVWQVKTKEEMKAKGADIPTAWLIIIPFINYYWLWKYSVGVEKVTNGKMTTVIAFILMMLLGVIGMAVVQNEFNQVSAEPGASSASAAPPTGPGSPIAESPIADAPGSTPPIDNQTPSSPISS